MSSSNCCFLTCIQVSQEADQVVWYSHLFQNFPQFVVIHNKLMTDVEAETPILWPPDAKSWLIGKDSDAGKDWGQEEKGMAEDEMVEWHHWLSGHGFRWTLGVSWWWTERPGMLWFMGSQRVRHDWVTELNWTDTEEWPSLVVQMVKNPPAVQEIRVQSLSQEDPLEKGMAIYFIILAWRIPWTEEPSRLQSMGSMCSPMTGWLTHTHSERWLGSPDCSSHCSALTSLQAWGSIFPRTAVQDFQPPPLPPLVLQQALWYHRHRQNSKA